MSVQAITLGCWLVAVGWLVYACHLLRAIRDDQRELIDLLTGRKPPAKAAPRTGKPAMPDGSGQVTTDEALPNLITLKRPRLSLRQFQRASERLAVGK